MSKPPNLKIGDGNAIVKPGNQCKRVTRTAGVRNSRPTTARA